MENKAIPASEGISIAKVFKFETIDIKPEKTQIKDVEAALKDLKKAMKTAVEEVIVIRDHTKKTMGDESAAIFDAHIQIIEDPEIFNEVKTMMETEAYNAAYAYDIVTKNYISLFESMEDNAYMQERAADVKDVSKRVLAKLLNIDLPNPLSIDSDVIVVAHDLTPSDTAQLNKHYVKGFITEIGGKTSHSAIMARMLEIPAIVGAKKVLSQVNQDDLMILDGLNGVYFTNPKTSLREDYEQKHSEFLQEKQRLKSLVNEKSVTKDGHQIEIAANIGSDEDIDSVLQNGAEGVGLYRTEFLYMNSSSMPSETVQFEAYKKVLDSMPNQKVIIRTLDIGGDKKLDYLEMNEEMNPFLGCRAVRLCMAEIDIFKTQLRALLKASYYGNLHIMFPMIATVDELIEAKKILKSCEEDLIKENIPIGDYKVGIMIEIPSTIFIAKHLAAHCDFFSIGTNDLIQYTFAADRMNETVAYLYQPFHPSILTMIKMVIDAAHEAGIWTGMCGEMAQEYKALPILLGLGLDEFSMSPSSILKSRESIRSMEFKKAQKLALEVLELKDESEVLKRLEEDENHG